MKTLKITKDHSAPKRPSSAMFLFFGSITEDLKLENPDMELSERSTLLAQKWTDLSDRGKQRYIIQAAKAKEEYKNVNNKS